MTPAELGQALQSPRLRLLTTDGRTLSLRITGKIADRKSGAIHIDIIDGLPAERDWQR